MRAGAEMHRGPPLNKALGSNDMRLANSITRTTFVSCLLILPTQLFAFNETLSFRLYSSGEVMAIVSGLSDGAGMCQEEFVAPSSTIVAGTNITITSPSVGFLCFIPLAPTPYRVVANLGPLAPSTYQVTWTQGGLVLNGQVSPAALALPAGIPALSPLGIALTALLMAGIGACSLTMRWSGP